MKTVIYFLLVFSLILSTSCSKENSLVPDVKPEEAEFTTANLVGNWNFVSVTMPTGETVTTCDAELLKTYGLVTLNLKNVTTTKITLYTDCNTQNILWEQERNYSFSNNTIILDNGDKFEILNISTFDGKTLKLKMVKSLQLNMPVNAIFILRKS